MSLPLNLPNLCVCTANTNAHTDAYMKPMHTPFVRVFDEEAGQQRLCVRGQRARQLDVFHEDELKQLLMVLVVEW